MLRITKSHYSTHANVRQLHMHGKKTVGLLFARERGCFVIGHCLYKFNILTLPLNLTLYACVSVTKSEGVIADNNSHAVGDISSPPAPTTNYESLRDLNMLRPDSYQELQSIPRPLGPDQQQHDYLTLIASTC